MGGERVERCGHVESGPGAFGRRISAQRQCPGFGDPLVVEEDAREAAASEVHLWTAWHAMRGNEESGSMVAKTPDTEFMRLLSGTHQINRAFERAGVAVGDEAAWVVFLPDFGLGEGFGDFSIPPQTYNDNSEEAIRLIEHLGGSLLAKRPVPSLAGLERVGASYPEDPSFPQMEEAFLGHTALSDLR